MNASRIRGIAAVVVLALGISGVNSAQSSPAPEQKQKPAAEKKAEPSPKPAGEQKTTRDKDGGITVHG